MAVDVEWSNTWRCGQKWGQVCFKVREWEKTWERQVNEPWLQTQWRTWCVTEFTFPLRRRLHMFFVIVAACGLFLCVHVTEKEKTGDWPESTCPELVCSYLFIYLTTVYLPTYIHAYTHACFCGKQLTEIFRYLKSSLDSSSKANIQQIYKVINWQREAKCSLCK